MTTPPAPTLAPGRDLYVVCDGLPGPGRDAAFVEVEDADGYSHGEDVGVAWAEHPSADGMYRLGPFRALIATARPLPAAPVAGAFVEAVDDLVEATKASMWLVSQWTDEQHDAARARCKAARLALMDAHAAEVQAAREEGRAGIDAAFESVATAGLDPSPGCSSSTVGITRDAWTDGTVAWSCDRDTAWTATPTAAILAAAAALAPTAEPAP